MRRQIYSSSSDMVTAQPNTFMVEYGELGSSLLSVINLPSISNNELDMEIVEQGWLYRSGKQGVT